MFGYSPGHPQQILSRTYEVEWNIIDQALCSSKIPGLKYSELDFDGDILLDDIHATFRRLMTKAYERGILWYKRRGYSEHLPPGLIASVIPTVSGPVLVASDGALRYSCLPLEWDDHW